MDSYLASEGFIAYQDRPETRGMRLLLNNGLFFEFIPFNEANFDEDGNLIANPTAFSINEVTEGVDYAIILSSCAGAWRYLIGDTIRFTNMEASEIIITGRTKHFLSICGEHLSIDNMNQAVQAVEAQLNTSIPEFTASAVRAEQFFSHKWYIGSDPLVDAKQVRTVLDEELKRVNDDYRTERGSVLKDIQVEVIPTHIFYKWHEAQGKIGGQNKFPRVMRGERFSKWEQFVRDSLATQAISTDEFTI